MGITKRQRKLQARQRLRAAAEGAQRLYVCPVCGRVESVCRSCDRGQEYCSAECRRQGRRRCNRAASKRYQATPDGAKKHSDRQRRYRARLKAKKASVTHQPLTTDREHSTCGNPRSESVESAAPTRYSCSECGMVNNGWFVAWKWASRQNPRWMEWRRAQGRQPANTCGS